MSLRFGWFDLPFQMPHATNRIRCIRSESVSEPQIPIPIPKMKSVVEQSSGLFCYIEDFATILNEVCMLVGRKNGCAGHSVVGECYCQDGILASLPAILNGWRRCVFVLSHLDPLHPDQFDNLLICHHRFDARNKSSVESGIGHARLAPRGHLRKQQGEEGG